jgi:hypothetical protein
MSGRENALIRRISARAFVSFSYNVLIVQNSRTGERDAYCADNQLVPFWPRVLACPMLTRGVRFHTDTLQ